LRKLNRASKAYHDDKFLDSPEARTLRILAEFLEPESRFAKESIEDTIVFFGSARILPSDKVKKEIKEIEGKLKKSNRLNIRLFRLYKQARVKLEFSKYYDDCVQLSYLLTQWAHSINKKRRFVVCSGGGPGIMEAANRGAQLAKGKSIGLNISLPHEQYPNPFISPDLNFEFHYFFMRKLWFAHLARAMVVFPGGFGTMDELLEILTLIQTKKIIKKLPILLYGKEYWSNIINFDMLVKYNMVNEDDLKIFHYSDTPKDALNWLKSELTKYYL
jgi:hypothetical protein